MACLGHFSLLQKENPLLQGAITDSNLDAMGMEEITAKIAAAIKECNWERNNIDLVTRLIQENRFSAQFIFSSLKKENFGKENHYSYDYEKMKYYALALTVRNKEMIPFFKKILTDSEIKLSIAQKSILLSGLQQNIPEDEFVEFLIAELLRVGSDDDGSYYRGFLEEMIKNEISSFVAVKIFEKCEQSGLYFRPNRFWQPTEFAIFRVLGAEKVSSINRQKLWERTTKFLSPKSYFEFWSNNFTPELANNFRSLAGCNEGEEAQTKALAATLLLFNHSPETYPIENYFVDLLSILERNLTEEGLLCEKQAPAWQGVKNYLAQNPTAVEEFCDSLLRETTIDSDKGVLLHKLIQPEFVTPEIFHFLQKNQKKSPLVSLFLGKICSSHNDIGKAKEYYQDFIDRYSKKDTFIENEIELISLLPDSGQAMIRDCLVSKLKNTIKQEKKLQSRNYSPGNASYDLVRTWANFLPVEAVEEAIDHYSQVNSWDNASNYVAGLSYGMRQNLLLAQKMFRFGIEKCFLNPQPSNFYWRNIMLEATKTTNFSISAADQAIILDDLKKSFFVSPDFYFPSLKILHSLGSKATKKAIISFWRQEKDYSTSNLSPAEIKQRESFLVTTVLDFLHEQ